MISDHEFSELAEQEFPDPGNNDVSYNLHELALQPNTLHLQKYSVQERTDSYQERNSVQTQHHEKWPGIFCEDQKSLGD